MSYNNYIDADAAIENLLALQLFTEKQVTKTAVVKHANACGLATAPTTAQSLSKAWQGDITSAFGSVIATDGEVDLESAEYFKDKFIEILIAPHFTVEAQKYLIEKSKNLRLLALSTLDSNLKNDDLNQSVNSTKTLANNSDLHLRYITGGLLVQAQDEKLLEKFEVVTQTQPLLDNRELYHFAYAAVKRLKSNAIAIAYEYQPHFFYVIGNGSWAT